VNKLEVIQKVIDKIEARNYLEIGLAKGDTFLRIKARRKIAVDPTIGIPKVKRIRWKFKNIYNMPAKYYELTSNDFFAQVEIKKGLDVVFIDGLHTFEQSLVDVNNSLKYLNKNGVIVMHDCDPPNEAGAYPAKSAEHAASLNLPGWTGAWCGDVWKTICYLRSFRKDLNVFVLDCDCGLGIVTKAKPESSLDLKEDELGGLTYSDLVRHKKEFLNLKPVGYLDAFLRDLPKV
jgi:hypothetical protein